MKCKLRIRSRGEGWTSDVDEGGELKFLEEGAEIVYLLEGDECRLYLSESFAEHSRKGANEIKMSFIPQAYGECLIGGAGSYKIFTERLVFLQGKRGCRALLDYRSGDDGEKISVEINAFVLV